MARVVRVSAHRTIAIDSGWSLAAVQPGADAPTDGAALDAYEARAALDSRGVRGATEAPVASAGIPAAPPIWFDAPVPGTVAGALSAAKAWTLGGPPRDFDASDWWYRCRFDALAAEAGESLVLRFGGLASVADVWLNGEHILRSENMFHAHHVDVTARLRGGTNELMIRFHAVAALLQQRRPGRDGGHAWSRSSSFVGSGPRFSGAFPVGHRASRRSARGEPSRSSGGASSR